MFSSSHIVASLSTLQLSSLTAKIDMECICEQNHLREEFVLQLPISKMVLRKAAQNRSFPINDT